MLAKGILARAVLRPLPMRVLTLTLTALVALAGTSAARRLPFTDSFMIERCQFSSSGANPYFVLKPGHQLTLEGKEKRKQIRLIITVLDETQLVGDVRTRVVEERETADGELREVSRNFFAICAPTDTVFYFGENVDIYERGAIVSHEGSWRAAPNGARPGVIMPGLNLAGARYFQEVAPGVALDRAETLSTTETVETPAGRFTNVLKVKETSALERRAKGLKFYAPGVGLIRDDTLQLVAVSAP
jgi:hypothetical protein